MIYWAVFVEDRESGDVVQVGAWLEQFEASELMNVIQKYNAANTISVRLEREVFR